MMIGALLALAAAAAAGLFLAIRHFRRKRLPALVALVHGLGGATGFTLVLLSVVGEPNFRPIRDSLYLLIATVAFGVVNLLFHIRRVRHRTSLIAVHALCAVSGVGLLIRAIVVHQPVEAANAAVALAVPPRAAESPLPAASATEAPTAPTPGESAAREPSEPPASETAAPKTQDAFALDPTVRRALDQEIQFASRSAAIASSSLSTVADMAKALAAHPEVVLVEVQGHADERGDDGRNIALTHARAHSVVRALIGNGVSSARLHEAGYGSRCPADAGCRAPDSAPSCHATEQWQKDRRVTFVVLQIGKSAFRGEVVCAAGAPLIPLADRRYNVLGK